MSHYKYMIKSRHELGSEELSQLNDLCIPAYDSGLHKVLEALEYVDTVDLEKDCPEFKHIYEGHRYVLCKSDEEIVGWIYFAPNSKKNRLSFMFMIYVHGDHRSLGIGGRLVKEMRKYLNDNVSKKCKISMTPFDYISDRFHSSISKKSMVNIISYESITHPYWKILNM